MSTQPNLTSSKVRFDRKMTLYLVVLGVVFDVLLHDVLDVVLGFTLVGHVV